MLQASMISGPILLLILIIADDVQYSANATYPPSSSNRRRATHQSAAPSQSPKMMKGRRRNHGRGTANSQLTESGPTFLTHSVIFSGRDATSPVNGDALTGCASERGIPAAMY